MSKVQPMQPDRSPQTVAKAIAVATFLRNDPQVKNTEAILDGKRCHYFRVKRAIRSLLSERYQKAQKEPLPRITNRNEATAVLALLPMTSTALRVDKEPPKKGDKKGQPVTLKINSHQDFQDNMHYVWLYEPKKPYLVLMAIAAVLVVLALVMFPLWPPSMRQGAYYLSLCGLGIVAAFFGLAIVRLILFIISTIVLSPGIWLFPNLFADCGVIDSFKPLWAWNETKQSKKKQRAALNQKQTATNGTKSTSTTTATTSPELKQRNLAPRVEDEE